MGLGGSSGLIRGHPTRTHHAHTKALTWLEFGFISTILSLDEPEVHVCEAFISSLRTLRKVHKKLTYIVLFQNWKEMRGSAKVVKKQCSISV